MKFNEVSASPEGDSITFHFHVYEQPRLRRLIYQAYHMYDMHVWKLSLAKWIDSKTGGVDGDEIKTPWFCNQDIRCYFLSIKGRRELLRIDVTPEQARNLGFAKFVGFFTAKS